MTPYLYAGYCRHFFSEYASEGVSPYPSVCLLVLLCVHYALCSMRRLIAAAAALSMVVREMSCDIVLAEEADKGVLSCATPHLIYLTTDNTTQMPIIFIYRTDHSSLLYYALLLFLIPLASCQFNFVRVRHK